MSEETKYECERCADMGTLYYVDYSTPCPVCLAKKELADVETV